MTPRGDDLAADDLPDYPHHWTADQRANAYWYAMSKGRLPSTTQGWIQVDIQRRNTVSRLNQLGLIPTPPASPPPPPTIDH